MVLEKDIHRINWTERRTNEDVLCYASGRKENNDIDTIKRKRWLMIKHTLKHEDELYSFIIEGMIEGKSRTKYII